jgi:hypothetical protein
MAQIIGCPKELDLDIWAANVWIDHTSTRFYVKIKPAQLEHPEIY